MKDRSEENARYWANKRKDPEFMARRRRKNAAANRRYRERKQRESNDLLLSQRIQEALGQMGVDEE